MFALFVLIAIIFIVFIYYSSYPKGKMGEKRVSYKTKSFARKNIKSESFDNVILKTLDGTTQIDHIIISVYGIFVIETKDYKGWVFGGEHQKTWTQSLIGPKNFSFFGRSYSSIQYKFQNPLRQNYKHMMTVQKFLNVDMNKIFSIIVFTGDSVFKTKMPDNVIELHELTSYLNSFKEQILSTETVEILSKKLTDYLLNLEIGEVDHIENVIHNRTNPICPKCGIKMVLRTAKKGKSAGSQFWGCCNFPLCKITKVYDK